MVEDCKSYEAKWADFLKEKCDIILDNDDTGEITGSDAGGSTTKTASSVVEEDGNVDRNFKDNYFNVNGLNVYLAKVVDGDLKVIEYSDSSLDEKSRYIWQALHSWWLEGALDLIAESYGDNFSFTNKNATIEKNLYVTFYNDPKDTTLAGVSVLNNSQGKWINSNGDIVGSLKLLINMKYYSSIIIGDEDGKRSNSDNFYPNLARIPPPL